MKPEERIKYILTMKSYDKKIARIAKHLIHCEAQKAPKPIRDNNWNNLKQAVEEYDKLYNSLDQAEREEAIEHGCLSCQDCVYYNDGYCDMTEDGTKADNLGCDLYLNKHIYGNEE